MLSVEADLRFRPQPPFDVIQGALPGEEFRRVEVNPGAVFVDPFTQDEFGHGQQQVGFGGGHGRHFDEGDGGFADRDAHVAAIAGKARERWTGKLHWLEDRQRGVQMVNGHPAVGIAGNDVVAVGAKLGGENASIYSQEITFGGTRVRVPETKRAIRGAGQKRPRIWAKGNPSRVRAGPEKRRHGLAGGRIPNASGVAPAAGGDQLSIEAETDVPYLARMLQGRAQGHSGAGIVDLGKGLGSGHHQAAAVGRKIQNLHAGCGQKHWRLKRSGVNIPKRDIGLRHDGEKIGTSPQAAHGTVVGERFAELLPGLEIRNSDLPGFVARGQTLRRGIEGERRDGSRVNRLRPLHSEIESSEDPKRLSVNQWRIVIGAGIE